MSRQRTRIKRAVGRPTGLGDTERIETLLGFLRKGNHIGASCDAAGLNQRTVYGWLEVANDADTRLTTARAEAEAEGRPEPAPASVLTAHEARCLQFSQVFTRARADSEVKVVGVIGKVIEGGYLISRKPSLTGEGMPIYNQDGELVYDEVYAQPDGKVALEMLSRMRPQTWGRQGPLQVELSGKDGGSLQVDSSLVVASFAERLASTLALPAGASGDLGEVVDAEIVGMDDQLAEPDRVSHSQ